MKINIKKLTILLIVTVICTIFVAAPIARADELCEDANETFGVPIFDCGTEDVVSFIGFKGGLSAPSPTDLDPSLTRAKTAREFIVNTLNFVLSFLGVVALSFVIYGGFLYVTAAGNEEQSTKGKKSLMYAVIGILIIIASFAIVNTLLTFGGGPSGDRGGRSGELRGVGGEGSNIGQQVIYNMGASEINTILNEFLGAYRNWIKVTALLTKLTQVQAPAKREENRAYISQVANVLSEIKNGSNALSATRQMTERMLDEYIFGIQNLTEEELQSRYEQLADSTAEGITGGGDSELSRDVLKKLAEEFNILEAAKKDFHGTLGDLIGTATPPDERPTETNVRGRLPLVWKIMGAVADSLNVQEASQQALDRGLINEKDLERAFAGIDPNITVGDLFKSALKQMDDVRNLVPRPDDDARFTTETFKQELQNVSRANLPEEIIQASKALYRLYIIVKDIKFVFVRIKGSVREGSAPLVVELNGLDSRDPVSQTIPNENYIWDPDGDGADDVQSSSSVECNNAVGPTITCMYKQPGTYLPRLYIQSQDPAHIASGQAFLAIKVQPSVARIALSATVGETTEELRKYQQDAEGKWNLVIDKNEYQVTTEEASGNGVTYDASESKGGGGEGIANFRWTFGDSSQQVDSPSANKVENHKYPNRAGKYPLTLEVTDQGNRKDRKIVNVIVASIAARIGTTQTIGEPDELLEFDGSLSRSDRGSISSYEWSVLNSEGKNVMNFQNEITVIGSPTSSVLRLKFKKPGTYTVKLGVSDGNNTAETNVPISIKSRKPRANFVVISCPENCIDRGQPSLVEFDASQSFDPDTGDELTYNWEIFNELGEKLAHPTGLTFINPPQLPSKEAKKMRVKFNKVGKYKIVLRVNDSHGGEIQQEDVKEKEIEIASIVEARFDPQMQAVKELENGRAAFLIKGSVRYADRVQIEFGDSESSEQSVTLTDNSGKFEFNHEYTASGSYLITVKALSEEGNGENTMTKRLYAASGDTPLAIIETRIDKNPVVLPDSSPENPNPALEVIRNKIIKFNAENSINSEGQASGLRYSWDFGDQKRSTGAEVEHSYEDLSPENSFFTVTLTVSEIRDPTKTAQAQFRVKVISKKPTVNTLSLEKQTPGETTPVEVKLTAEGASDQDGRITNYQFWYYNPEDRERKLAVIDTQSGSALLTVETAGEENEEHEYFFCVSVTDNENTLSECNELFSQDELPRLKVKNGPNKAPVAAFSADRTSVRVGDSITFNSSSTDEDGRITQYIWDIEGDGFHNNNPTELASITHRYERKSPTSGYRVKLKAIDDKGAAGYSREIPIHVEAKSNPPTANFSYQVQTSPARRVKFFDASTADTINGASITKWTWDFDTSQEFGCEQEPRPAYCNGDKTDDIDSNDQNPTYEFPEAATYQVKLIVEDSDGNISPPKTALITIVAGASGGTGPSTPVSNILNAELTTNPAPLFQQIPNCTPPTSDTCKRKVLRLPATSNGQGVSLIWRDSTGDITSYKIDKNTWCDSGRDASAGDGNRANDEDHVYPDATDPNAGSCALASNGAPGDSCWTTNYNRFAQTAHPQGPGHFKALLTVIDRNSTTENPIIDTDEVEIIFDGATDPNQMRTDGCEVTSGTLGASLFKDLGLRNIILLGITAGAMLVLIAWGAASFSIRGRRRI